MKVRSQTFYAWALSRTTGDVLDDGHPLPLLTLLLYRVCDNDLHKFEILCDAMSDAFEGGQRCADQGAERLAGTTRGPTAGRTEPAGSKPGDGENTT